MRTTIPTDSFDRDVAEIEESVNEIAGHLNAQHARLVDHVATLDATSDDDSDADDDSGADGGDEQDEADGHADAAAPTSGSPVRAPETVEEFCSMLWNDDGTFQIHAAADAETGLTRHSPTRSAINSCVTERSCRRGARTDSRCPSAGANTSSPIAPARSPNTVTTAGAESLAAPPATTSRSTTSSTGSRADRPIPGI